MRSGAGKHFPPAETLDVSVTLVIILYRTAVQLPSYLNQLQAQRELDWRMVAVDNASPDESVAILEERRDPRITIIRNQQNRGFAAAANQGLQAGFGAGADLCVLMNVDTIFVPTFLGDFLAVQQRIRAAVISPRIMHADKPDSAWYAGGHFENGWLFENVHDAFDADNPGEVRAVEFASGCCLGVTRAVLDSAGLLDESFFVYWEDVDFCLRLKALNIPVYYAPEPSILHIGAAASGGVFTASHKALFYRSYMQLIHKHFGLPRAFLIMMRLLAKQWRDSGRDISKVANLFVTLIRGLFARLRPVPRLSAPSRRPSSTVIP